MITNFKIYEQKQTPVITYWDNGNKQSERWFLDNKYHNKFHRESGPAVQWWYESGQKHTEGWYLNGEYHRESGPAYQWWSESGQKQSEQWYLNGKWHRESGPAYQWWYESGQKEREEWYLNNIEYTRSEWLKELKRIGSPHYEDQKMKYNLEKYNL